MSSYSGLDIYLFAHKSTASYILHISSYIYVHIYYILYSACSTTKATRNISNAHDFEFESDIFHRLK